MTMNFKVADFESEPVVKFKDGDKRKVVLDWVTHGNFALWSDNEYCSLEPQHFAEILKAYETTPKPSGRTPFWKGKIPPRGMCFYDYLVEAYASDTHIKLIKSTCDGGFGPSWPHYHAQLVVSAAAFAKVVEAVHQYIGRRHGDTQGVPPIEHNSD